LDEANALLDAGIPCGLFVDDDAGYSARRQALAARPNCAAGVWSGARNIEDAVALWLQADRLADLVDVATKTGAPRRSLLQHLGDASGRPGERTIDDLIADLGEVETRRVLSQAMQSGKWFKTYAGGHDLAVALVDWGVPVQIASHMDTFWAALRRLA